MMLFSRPPSSRKLVLETPLNHLSDEGGELRATWRRGGPGVTLYQPVDLTNNFVRRSSREARSHCEALRRSDQTGCMAHARTAVMTTSGTSLGWEIGGVADRRVPSPGRLHGVASSGAS